jgi:cell division transport system ATP-binding protein
MLADEPTGNLDPETSNIVIKLFKEINAKGTTVLIATHNKELFIGTGRRVISIKDKVIDKETIA